MFIAANFLTAVAAVAGIVLSLFKWMLIIKALLSWVNPDPYNPIVKFLTRVTEPVLYKIRQVVPTYFFGLDLSVLVALLLIIFLEIFLVGTLNGLAMRLG